MADDYESGLPEVTTVDFLRGLKEISPGADKYNSVKIARALVTGGASDADVNAVNERVDDNEDRLDAIESDTSEIPGALAAKADKATAGTGTGAATVTGDLGTGLTVAVPIASTPEAVARTIDDKVMTPAKTGALIDEFARHDGRDNVLEIIGADGAAGFIIDADGQIENAHIQEIEGRIPVDAGVDYVWAVGPEGLEGLAVDADGTLYSKHIEEIEARIAAVEAAGATPFSGEYLRGSTLVERQMFPGSSTPAGWSISGWTVSDGLVSPGSGGWSTIAQYDKFSAAMWKEVSQRWVFTSATSAVALTFFPMDSPSITAGTVVLVDASAGAAAATISVKPWNGSGAPTGGTTTAIPFTLIAGRAYRIIARKTIGVFTATFIDTITGDQVVVTGEMDGTLGLVGRQWGKPGVVFISGSVTVSQFEYSIGVAQSPKAILFGDSILEGPTLYTEWRNSWGVVLNATRNKGDILIAARGGDTGAGALARMDTDLDLFNPECVVWALHANDTNTATMQANTISAIAKILARGALPILATLTPNTAAIAKNTTHNTWLRSTYGGVYPIIEFARALSASHDDGDWNPLYNSGDGLHPNVLGELRMERQAQIDAPFLYY